jgi:ankyrin repeat protein
MLPDYELIDAVKRDCLDDFERAIGQGAKPTAHDVLGRPAVEVAMRYNSPATMRRLIRLGADSNPRVGRNGDLLIHRAAKAGDHDTLSILLESGVDANCTGAGGMTALYILCERGHEYLAGMLLKKGSNPHLATPRRDTPMHEAARRGHHNLVQILLEHSANPLAENYTQYTPVHEGAAAGHLKVTEAFLRSSLKPPRTDKLWRRVAEAVRLHGHSGLAQTILETEQRQDFGDPKPSPASPASPSY